MVLPICIAVPGANILQRRHARGNKGKSGKYLVKIKFCRENGGDTLPDYVNLDLLFTFR